MNALYLHIPFCFHKCHYCDFFSIVDTKSQEAFGHALAKEIDSRAAAFDLRPTTVFVGGGTPTFLEPRHWRPILDSLARNRVLQNVSEFTVEANPETVTAEVAAMLRDAGVNRVSLGAQSFQPRLLKALERWHDPASIPRALETLRSVGIENLNIDLIFSIPGQTLDELDDDLSRALSLPIEHLSVYGLTFEPNTVLGKQLELGRVQPNDEELERRMFEQVLARLAGAGFEHYEISNHARRREAVDRRCRHNLAYWRNLNWIGLGPGAGSHYEGWRWKNLGHLHRYLDNPQDPPTSEMERYEPDRAIGEELMVGLRLIEGIDAPRFDGLVQSTDVRRAEAEYLFQIGMLRRENGRVRLTRAGLFVADEVIRRLL